jgi:hypothetical protein
MFELTRTEKPLTTWGIDQSEFDKSYPKESFSPEDPDNVPVDSVLLYCCGILHESGLFKFTLDSCGLRTELEIYTEMDILLEQIASLTDFLRSETQDWFSIVFFEQGCEFSINFTRNEGDSVAISIPWKKDQPAFEGRYTISELRSHASRFILSFIHAVSLLIPCALEEWGFREWTSRLIFESQ